MRPRGADGADRPGRTPRRRALAAAALLAAAWAVPAAAADWIVLPEESRLAVTIAVGEERMTGEFARWSAEIAFDPAHPERCRVRVEVDVSSLSFPDEMATGAAREPQWLAAGAHPLAVFEGEGFHREAPGAWTVSGELSLKDARRPLDLQVVIVTEGAQADAAVSAELLRGDFGVGNEGEMMVAPVVSIDALVTARRAD